MSALRGNSDRPESFRQDSERPLPGALFLSRSVPVAPWKTAAVQPPGAASAAPASGRARPGPHCALRFPRISVLFSPSKPQLAPVFGYRIPASSRADTMNKQSRRKAAAMRRGAVLASLVPLLAGPLAAQVAPTPSPTASASATSETKVLEAFEVTGSRVKRLDYETTSPVVTFTSAAIEDKGFPSLGEFVQSLPTTTAPPFRSLRRAPSFPAPRRLIRAAWVRTACSRWSTAAAGFRMH